MHFNIYTFKNIPLIEFAHFFSTDRYNFNFGVIPNAFEIVLCERGKMNIQYEDHTYIIQEGGLNIIPHNKPLKAYSDNPGHGLATISVNVPYELEQITEDEVIEISKANNRPGVFLIVASEMPSGMQVEKITVAMKKLIKEFETDITSDKTYFISGLFNLFSMITAESVRIARLKYDLTPMPIYSLYSKKAIGYIAENIKENISTNDIASYLGISTGYLCKIFKIFTGKTVVEYINSYRIKRVAEMILVYNMSLKEAGEKVGLYNEPYLSRLFKKYTGYSTQEYKLIHKIKV
jgi:AraC-like DNA-binding protein